MPFGVNGLGLVVESHEGRPTKIEGNELHPATLGAASAWVQAESYQLYDPDRAREVLLPEQHHDWAKFLDWWKDQHAGLATDQGESLAVVLEPFSSPTKARLVDELKRTFPRARVVAYARSVTRTSTRASRRRAAPSTSPSITLDKARVIVSLDADFPSTTAIRCDTRAASRRGAVERGDEPTLRGGERAHHHGHRRRSRLRLQSRRIAAFAAALGAELGMGAAAGSAGGFDAKWLQAVARDLKANAGKSLIVAGAHQPAAVHAAAAALNAALGNVGSTVTYVDPKETLRSSSDGVEAARHRHAGGENQAAGRGRRQSRIRRPGRRRLRRRDVEGQEPQSASARTSTRLPRSAIGTSPRRISSRRGATSAAWRVRSPSSSR
jgi:molybdopterin-containing oxidoreductase family iron-sulfur binding subunit